ncbi:hypothetical protein 1 [Hubei tombus-like virus 26]|uniref:hypothetical protein 1 n=1 Tax=Hubei tombus-like virus 26 TaxID=1923273 RepID=UPI00090C403A|nr:hypothetical protein 1 [Hubei tombus-like virus 26]APG76343.1 hypothetical protein 1 [Hubei tombus-like virus 26]
MALPKASETLSPQDFPNPPKTLAPIPSLPDSLPKSLKHSRKCTPGTFDHQRLASELEGVVTCNNTYTHLHDTVNIHTNLQDELNAHLELAMALKPRNVDFYRQAIGESQNFLNRYNVNLPSARLLLIRNSLDFLSSLTQTEQLIHSKVEKTQKFSGLKYIKENSLSKVNHILSKIASRPDFRLKAHVSRSYKLYTQLKSHIHYQYTLTLIPITLIFSILTLPLTILRALQTRWRASSTGTTTTVFLNPMFSYVLPKFSATSQNKPLKASEIYLRHTAYAETSAPCRKMNILKLCLLSTLAFLVFLSIMLITM